MSHDWLAGLRSRKRLMPLVLGVIAMLAFSACSSGGGASQEDLDKAEADLAAAQTNLTAARDQIAALQAQVSGYAPVSIVQTGQLVPAPEGPDPTGWANAESIRGGLQLVATYDSSGPDAWDINEHSLVYYTSESSSNPNPARDKNAPYFAGFHVIDAYTKQVIASGLYSFEGNLTRGPHGVDTSPDGKWVYVGFSETKASGDRISYVAIVNARTLKLDKLLKQESYFEGGMRSQALHHIQSFIDWEGNPRVILQWGFGALGGPHHILDPNDDNRVWKSITYDDIMPMGHPFTTPSPDGRYIYVSIGANWIRDNHAPAAGIAKLDLATGSHVTIEGVGHHPIGITHTADGHWTYVVDAEASQVYKIDNEINEVVAVTSAGVAGPYGICLNWDETEIWLVGKGEGSHNVGNSLGMIDARTFTPSKKFNQPLYLGGSASSVDHCILHPDPDVNEIWVSNMNGWETIVVSLDTYKVTDYIPTPNGGDTHSGGFVKYNPDWTGELLADMGGPKSESIWQIKRELISKGQAAP